VHSRNLLISHLPSSSSSNAVFITGANRGIGLGLTRSFLKDEFNVIATTRSVDPSKAQDLLDLKAQHDAQLRIEVRELSYDIFFFLIYVLSLLFFLKNPATVRKRSQ
jgi:NAD(P)-dependent dehydrogenase (short-subunit alcohol dehydrogenase family)